MSEDLKNKVRKTLVKSDNNQQKPTKERRKISRRKPGQKKVNYYFTMDTQDSIVAYQCTEDSKKKEKIYVKEILPAFDALVENLINVYGFKAMHESKQDLKAECLEFLYTTVNKFNPEKGSKAFAYFNIVAKNWLTIKSKKNAQRTKQYVSSDHRESLSQSDLDQLENYKVFSSRIIDEDKLKIFLSGSKWTEYDLSLIDKYNSYKGSNEFAYSNNEVQFLTEEKNHSEYDLKVINSYKTIKNDENIIDRVEIYALLLDLVVELENRVKLDNERLVINAIKQIIDNIDDLEFLTKRAVLLYIRNIAKLSSKQLSLILSSLKKHYKEIKKEKENISS